MQAISDKGLLTHSIEVMRVAHAGAFAFYPPSFTIPMQQQAFASRAAAEAEAEAGAVWLVKPRALCCGKGIRLIGPEEAARSRRDTAEIS